VLEGGLDEPARRAMIITRGSARLASEVGKAEGSEREEGG
jgi:hypothetical protein